MKKSFVILSALLIIACCLVSCTGRSIYAMERDAEKEAMEEKYREGISAAQEEIANLIEIEMWDLDYDIEEKWGMSVEEAIDILTDYAEGTSSSSRQINKAIWAIRYYYVNSTDIINGIDDYWID